MEIGYTVTNPDSGETTYHVFTTNGFVPTEWIVSVDAMPAEDVEIIVYFEPVVKSTVYENGAIVITYHDGTQKKIDLANVNGIKLEGNQLQYTVAGSNEAVTIGSFVTAAEFATLQETVEKLDAALKALETKVDTKDAALQAEIDALKASVATNLTSINENAAAIADLEAAIEALEAKVEALEGKDTTYLILIIIVGVIAVASAAGVVVLFVKKK